MPLQLCVCVTIECQTQPCHNPSDSTLSAGRRGAWESVNRLSKSVALPNNPKGNVGLRGACPELVEGLSPTYPATVVYIRAATVRERKTCRLLTHAAQIFSWISLRRSRATSLLFAFSGSRMELNEPLREVDFQSPIHQEPHPKQCIV